MKRNKVKEINRLRRTHIWPSVVFLCFSTVLYVIAFSFMTSVILGYFSKDRLETEWNAVLRVSQMFSEESSDADVKNIVKYLEGNPEFYKAVYVLDKDNGVIAGFGGQTYDLDIIGAIVNLDDAIIYADRESEYNLSELEGDYGVNAVLEKLMGSGVSIDKLFSKQDIVIDKMPFWYGIGVPGGRTVMVKCEISFYMTDFAIAGAMGLFTGIVMFPSLVFLLVNVIINVRDQRRMRELLYTDAVTSGKNWMYYENHARRIFRSKGNAGKQYAMVDITLMKYRSYCTCYGVDAGEELLENIDMNLNSKQFCADKSECCAHTGKSSFALLLKYNDTQSCTDRVGSMIRKLPEILGHSGLVFHAGINFVGAMDGETKITYGKNFDVAGQFNRASAARATAADESQPAVIVYDKKILEEQIWERRVEEKMHRALEKEEFKVYIQPKYNPVTEKLAGAEALVRWINDEDGFISPGRFIPIFEKNGFITSLDDYMISHVAKLQADWLAEGKEVVPISVNVSRAHFANPNLAEHICGLVDAYGVPHRLIEIELTESAFFDDKAALLNTVHSLKEMGFDISMDDFGAGYSSLNSLKDLPLDVLKLDAEFFRGDEDGDARGEIVVAEAIDLAKKLNMRIVAEGVEKKNQVDFLARQNCDMIQGFYFAKPMPAEEYEERLEAQSGANRS